MALSLTGVVSSNKGNKTIVVTVTNRRTHPLYKKQYTINTRFMAHDEQNQAKPGDKVIIKETRPLSARKRFILDKIIDKAGAGFKETDATADIPEPELQKEVQKKDAPKEKQVKEKQT